MSEHMQLQVQTATLAPVLSFSPYPSEPFVRVSPESTSAATSGIRRFKPDMSPDQLMFASHAGGTKVSLQFADGYQATVDIANLGIDAARLKFSTTRASSWGSAVEVEDATGKIVHIDSAVLRAYCDPPYAEQLGQAIAAARPAHG